MSTILITHSPPIGSHVLMTSGKKNFLQIEQRMINEEDKVEANVHVRT